MFFYLFILTSNLIVFFIFLFVCLLVYNIVTANDPAYSTSKEEWCQKYHNINFMCEHVPNNQLLKNEVVILLHLQLCSAVRRLLLSDTNF